MKRFHLHISVKDLDESIRFYSTLFAEQPCCYARSDKYWVTDPTGIAWETFHTLGSIPVYGKDTAVFDHGASPAPVPNESRATATCCVPAQKATGAGCCD